LAETRQNALGEFAAVMLGIAAFFVFAGWWVLIPTNLAWLGMNDRAMHTLGWMFYRDAPWQWPPGASPGLGLELANSIALVDSLPLIAMPLKLFSAWLPRPFQYWGYWWVVCFMLQGLFSYRLARAFGATAAIAFCAAGFALITPAFFFRLSLHMALAGHWLILAALWLYAREQAPRWWTWPLLMLVTAGTHIYLLVMVAPIWLAAILSRWLTGRDRLAPLARELVLGLGGAVLMLYLGGAFIGLGSGEIDGYGAYRLNLLFPVIDYGVWSKLMPRVPHDTFDYEGISFFGIGIFAALLLAFLSRATKPINAMLSRRWAPLTILIFLFFVFALSNQIGFADYGFAPIPIPGFVRAIGNMFRSTGRFVWPLLYIVTIGTVVLVGRRFGDRWAVPFFVIAFAAQVYDSSDGWTIFRNTMSPPPATSWPTAWSSPFWERAGEAGFTRLRGIPVRYRHRDWLAAETFAYRYGLQTDMIYLGRVDEREVAALAARENEAITTGNFDDKTLYILNYAAARRIAPHVQPDDLFAVVQDRFVFARHAAFLVDGLGISAQGALTAPPWVPDDVARSAGLPY